MTQESQIERVVRLSFSVADYIHVSSLLSNIDNERAGSQVQTRQSKC